MPVTLLADIEARILGSLVEKSYTTPEQYPLSLNALTNACNQKSSRDPVMKLDETTIARAIATLQQKGLVDRRSEPGSRVTKFLHHVENLLGGGTAQEIGTICVLLLRGPQTPGEIKTRTDRICEFSSTADVEAVLLEMAGRTDGPFVSRLPRQPGQKEARYMHLFCGKPDTPTPPKPAQPGKPLVSPPAKVTTTDLLTRLQQRVSALEAAVQELQNHRQKEKEKTF
jgi:uncharacterized protein YceH (UPF0502 family)